MNDRRAFFQHFMGYLNIFYEEARGHRHFKLEDLWKLNEEMFRKLKIRVREGVQICIDEQEGTAVNANGEKIALYKTGTEQEVLFRSIQKRRTVDEMIKQIHSQYELEVSACYTLIRNYILELVKQGICVPANDVHYKQESNKKEENK